MLERVHSHTHSCTHACTREDEKVNCIIVLTLFREFLNEAWDFVMAGKAKVRFSVYVKLRVTGCQDIKLEYTPSSADD